MSEDLKECTNCKEKKPLSEFYPHPNTVDKLRPTCIKCCNENTNQYREENLEYFKEYRSKNKDRLKFLIKQWGEKNKIYKREKNTEYMRNRRAALREAKTQEECDDKNTV